MHHPFHRGVGTQDGARTHGNSLALVPQLILLPGNKIFPQGLRMWRSHSTILRLPFTQQRAAQVDPSG